MTLRTTASFDGKNEEILRAWADKEYRTPASLVIGIVNSVIDGNPLKVPAGLAKPDKQDLGDRALTFLKNVVAGREQNILDVQRLADELGIPSERLAKIIVENGAKKNVRSAKN